MKQTKNAALAAVVVLVMSGCGGESSPQQTAQGDGAQPVSNGEQIYKNYCSSCHTPGLSGAPKLGDQEVWAPRIAKGKALLLEATIAGVPPAMPPRGMCFDCSDDDLAAAIDYMVARSQ